MIIIIIIIIIIINICKLPLKYCDMITVCIIIFSYLLRNEANY